MDRAASAQPDLDQHDQESLLASIGFDDPRGSWLQRLREADSSLPLGSVGPYELLADIGRGGQGVVYKALQPGTHRQIALKRLLAGPFATPAMRQRIEREVEALAALNHPYIVTVFAVDVIDGVPALVMEWIDGIPITSWAQQDARRRRPNEAARMLLKVSGAVHHAHQRGVIHRDLKPSNILIDADERPHVLDFGLAKLIAGGGAYESLTITDQFIGTLSYASPEQLRGQPEHVDVRSDVYSLGVILYELLAGRLPYATGGNLADVTQAIEHAEPLRPSSVVKGLPPDLEAIVLKAISKEQASRYQSVDALASDLRSYLAGEPVTARLPGSFSQLVKSMRRHRLAVAFGATVFVLITAFAIVATVLALRLAEQRDLAVASQNRAQQAGDWAEQQAAKAQAISNFLQKTLSSTEPLWSPDAGVREVLDAAAGRIETDLEKTEQADVRIVIAKMYQGLGLYESAESQLRAALQHYRDQHGDHHPDVVVTLSQLAELLHARGDHQAAGVVIQEAVSLYRRVLSQGHPLLEANLTGMAGYLCMTGAADEAEALYRETLAAHVKLFGEHHAEVADDLRGLSSLLSHLGKWDEAVDCSRRTIDMRRALVGEEHPELAADLYNLGAVLNQSGQYAAAETVLQQALSMRRRLLGNDHPAVDETLYRLALTLSKMHRADASPVFSEVLELRTRLYGQDHEFVAICQAEFGRFLHERDDHSEAETYLSAALQTFRVVFGEAHWRTAGVESDLGGCLTSLERYSAAEPLLLNSYGVIQAKRGGQHVRSQQAAQRIVDLYLAWGKPDQAAVWLARLEQ